MFEFIQTIASKVITGIVGVGLLVGSIFGINSSTDNFGATVPIVTALFSTTLASGITSTADSFTLVSGTTIDGTTLNGTYGFIVDEGTSSEEFIIAVCVDTTCSSATRGISGITGNTSVTALKSAHAKGASVKISDHPQLAIVSRIVNGDESFPNGMTITGAVTSSAGGVFGAKLTYTNTETINNDKDLATKAYVDSAVVSGAPDASLTAKGVSEEATASQINAGTQAGETSAELFVNPKYLQDSYYYTYRPTSDEKAALAGTGTPSSANKYCTADYPIPASYLDTTTTLGTSDTKVPTQKAVKTYVDTNLLTAVLIASASDNLKISNNTEKTSASPGSSYVASGKEIEVLTAGVVRVHYDYAQNSSNSGVSNFKIYVNGAAVGAEMSASSTTTYATSGADDITVKVGDLVQIYWHGAASSNGGCKVQNFRIYFDLTQGYGINTGT